MPELIIGHHIGNLSVFEIGFEKCLPNHSNCISYDNQSYLLHYISDGEGSFQTGGREYVLSAGSAFLISSNQCFYQASLEKPWSYYWIHFSGDAAKCFLSSASLSADQPVYFTKKNNLITMDFKNTYKVWMSGHASVSEEKLFLLMGSIYNLFGDMLETSDAKSAVYSMKKNSNKAVSMCENYVKHNYWKKISLNELSTITNLDPSYLHRLFKKELGISPGEYILKFKINRAQHLLNTTDLSIGDIASSVGYQDQLAFSKIFAKRIGMSPQKYKNMHKRKHKS